MVKSGTAKSVGGLFKFLNSNLSSHTFVMDYNGSENCSRLWLIRLHQRLENTHTRKCISGSNRTIIVTSPHNVFRVIKYRFN